MTPILDDFFPISIKGIAPGKELPFDVWCYFKLNQKIVVLRKSRDNFNSESLQDLKSKEINFLYILKTDKAKYQDFLASEVAALFADESISEQKKVAQVGLKTRNMLTQIQSINSVEDAKAFIEGMNDFSQGLIRQCTSAQFSNNFNNLQRFLKKGSDLTVHSLNVSSLCVVFSLALEKVELSFIESLVQAGLIHDLALIDADNKLVNEYLNDPKQFQKTVSKLPPDDPYFSHGSRLIQFIESKGLILPLSIKEIIMQHHETYEGTGFPRRLKGSAITFGAKILQICNDYEIKFRAYLHNNELEKVRTILGEMNDYQAKCKTYDPRILSALVNIVEKSAPTQGVKVA